ncbi:MAG TPA: DUF3300 domain-containing protein [Candidatus Acidoferrales bacterium]|nr:DUF3300 domain-containing protein [Candidatus Acidoferrales bacterium]
MRILPGGSLLLSFLISILLFGAARTEALPAQDPAQQSPDQSQNPDQAQNPDQSVYADYAPDQLDNLLAPIALYPDPLLAQVLVAATFPDQIDEASRFLRGGGSADDIDNQNWDVSVKAVAHYPTVLYMMDNRLDWTTSLGQAYVNQSTDVQTSIQRLRGMAHDAGTLQSGPQMDVENQGGYWDIWPVEPQMIYVPVYDPAILYIGRRGWIGPYITFGVGFPIGAWLCYDFGWGGPGIYYFGWGGHLPPWAVRSRPFVHINSVYVNERYRNVTVNRAVLNRRVNVENLNRYNAVHRDVRYSNVAVGNAERANERVGERPNRPVNNQVVQRNINTSDTRIQDFRGHEGGGASMTMEGQGRPAPVEQPRPVEQARPPAQPQARPPERPAPPPQARPAPQPVARPNTAFDTEPRTFNPSQSSQRGQSSRQAPVSRPAPAPAPPSGGGKRP